MGLGWCLSGVETALRKNKSSLSFSHIQRTFDVRQAAIIYYSALGSALRLSLGTL
jgi:hypothetical protein